jgi:hypothetical protein
MSVNKYKPHLLVLPEDDANRQIANGFLLHPRLKSRAVQVLGPADGWGKAVSCIPHQELEKYTERRVVLLIDFDGKYPQRIDDVVKDILPQTADRVFVLGSLIEPERLRSALNKTFEEIGRALAQDCVDDERSLWGHAHLAHNARELDRMIADVKPFLFD